MSAWIVTQQHIDVLTKALFDYKIVGDSPPTLVGRELWQENLNSIHACYPDTEEEHKEYPGAPIHFKGPETVATYEYADPGDVLMVEEVDRSTREYVEVPFKVTPDLLLKATGCYAYQTCEHVEWPTTRAHRWIEDLSEALVKAGASRSSKAYHDAPWGL